MLLHFIRVHGLTKLIDQLVAVVSVVAKVLEKLLPFNILYRETSVITHMHQGTYQHDKSTEGILLVAVDAIAHHMERGESMHASCLYIFVRLLTL